MGIEPMGEGCDFDVLWQDEVEEKKRMEAIGRATVHLCELLRENGEFVKAMSSRKVVVGEVKAVRVEEVVQQEMQVVETVFEEKVEVFQEVVEQLQIVGEESVVAEPEGKEVFQEMTGRLQVVEEVVQQEVQVTEEVIETVFEEKVEVLQEVTGQMQVVEEESAAALASKRVRRLGPPGEILGPVARLV